MVKRKTNRKRGKSISISELKNKVQAIFNEYIRLRDKNRPCISCGEFKKLQAGHFFPVRGYDGVRFDEFNVNGECAGCNGFNNAHLIFYAINLKKKIGDENFEKLIKKAVHYKKNGYKWKIDELEEKLNYYKKEVDKLKNAKVS